MLNDSQQRKALVLSLLMVMLAQTAYIESYRGGRLLRRPRRPTSTPHAPAQADPPGRQSTSMR